MNINSEYHKIHTMFTRDQTTKKVVSGEWRLSVFDVLRDVPWTITEKVDGTNIRVQWSGSGKVTFGGRTDNAQIPAKLIDHLRQTFPTTKFEDGRPIMLYGEGYGAGIQKGGGDYRADQGFILFDAWAGGMWLERETVQEIGDRMGVPVVPVLGSMPLREAADMCRNGFASELRSSPPEGIIARPHVELLDRRGRRIITKLKLRDF